MIIRRPRLLYRCLIVVLAATMSTALSGPVASATPAASDGAVRIPTRSTGASVVHEFPANAYGQRHVRTYGSATDSAKRIVISPETTQVVLEPGLHFVGEDVGCQAISPSPVAIEPYYATGSDWDNDPAPTVAVRPGAVVAGSGTVFRYSCSSAAYEFFFWSDETVWEFVEGPGAGSTVTLGSDQKLLTAELAEVDYTDFFDQGDPIPVAPGDRFVVSGPSDSWGAAAATQRQAALDPVGFAGPTIPAEGLTVTPDGSALAFSLPAAIDAAYQNNVGQVSASTTTESAGPFGQTRTTTARWSAYVAVETRAPTESHIRATLDRTYTVSVLRPRLTVTVESDAVPDAAGTVIVTIDGVDRLSRTFPAVQRTSRTLLLPTLSRGVHTITARYLGSGTVAPSATGTLRLHVLI